MKAWLGKNWFIIGLLGVVGLAFVYPDPGAKGGWLQAEVTTKVAVALIFFLQGLILALDALREGMLRWRLHVLVQTFTYIVFPLFVIGLDAVFGRMVPENLRIGFLFLAALPTTVSTAMVFTTLAGGNSAGALVNVTLSNVMGVVVTPLWVGVLLQVKGQAVPLLPMIQSLAMLILLPLVVGQLVRPFLHHWADANRARVGKINSLLVLFIVYATFCNSVKSGVFVAHGWTPALVSAVGSLVIFVVVTLLVVFVSRIAGLPPADRTAALFCAPQKTLASGIPMGRLIFASNPALGIILLPIMFYHPLQLLIGGVLVNAIKARGSKEV